MPYRAWTAEHDEQLLTLRMTGMKWLLVANMIGRTEAATITRAGILKKIAADRGASSPQPRAVPRLRSAPKAGSR